MGALDVARAHAADADDTMGAIRHNHLTAVQAYATLALAEALTTITAHAAVEQPTMQVTEFSLDDDVRDETLYETAQELAADLLRMDDEQAITLAQWPTAKALVALIRPAALAELDDPVPFVPVDDAAAYNATEPALFIRAGHLFTAAIGVDPASGFRYLGCTCDKLAHPCEIHDCTGGSPDVVRS
jgi:hypothetical protein